MAAAPPCAPFGALCAAPSPSPLLRQRRAAPSAARRRRAAHAGGGNGSNGNSSAGVAHEASAAGAARSAANAAAAATAEVAAAPRAGIMAAWLEQLRRDGALLRVTQAEADNAMALLKAKARTTPLRIHHLPTPKPLQVALSVVGRARARFC
jgi:hypothetical protein